MTATLSKRKLIATFPYHDEAGKVVYECLRFEEDGKKKFSYRRPQPDGGGWVWNLEGVKKVLYRLPELIDPAKKQHPVFVVEGEGKVEALRKLGFMATSAPCGAGHWVKEYGSVLSKRRVVILPDNDEPGWNHALHVCASLIAWEAAAIWLIHLPGLPDGGDVIDWFASLTSPAHCKAALIEQVKAAKKWEWK